MTAEVAGGLFALVWTAGWFTFGVVFTLRWRKQRREDPKYTPPYFPWDRVLISGLFIWWLVLPMWARDWFVARRRAKP